MLDAARYAAWYDAWGAACNAARHTARYDAWYDARADGRYAARDATVALVVCDLVGQYGLQQHHIELLLEPWVAVCGDPRTQGDTTMSTATVWTIQIDDPEDLWGAFPSEAEAVAHLDEVRLEYPSADPTVIKWPAGVIAACCGSTPTMLLARDYDDRTESA